MIYRNLNLVWLGHSAFKIKFGSGKDAKIIYIDPYKIAEESESADFIFITHSHYDHCSIEDIQKIAVDGTTLIAPADVSSKFKHINKKLNIIIADVDEAETISLIEDKLKFWCIPAYNPNESFHSREENWVGFIIQLNDTLIYHAGDTHLIPEMNKLKLIGIDIAMLPIGGTYTMNAGEAAKAASIIKPKIAIPMHYGMIEKTGSKSEADIFSKLCSAEGIDVKVLEIEK